MKRRLRVALPALRRQPAFTGIEGQTSVEECAWLRTAASTTRGGCIVEIGSYRGRSTAALAEGARLNASAPSVYAVDPHETFTGVLGGRFGPADRVAFFRNLDRARLLELVRLVNLPSPVVGSVFPHDVGLLWIDGDHTEAGVRADFESWSPRLTRDAVVAFHDSLDPSLGPARLIADLIGSGRWQVVATVGTLTALRRASEPA